MTENIFIQRPGGGGGSPGGAAWLAVFVPGMALIAVGIAIVVFPKLLAVLVAGFCMFVGLILASLGWRLRRGLPGGFGPGGFGGGFPPGGPGA